MKIAIITGASSGLGKEFVKQTVEEGGNDQIWVIARREDRLNELKKEYGDIIVPIAGDLTNPKFIYEYMIKLENEKPFVRLLVNASGFAKFGNYESIPIEQSLGMIDLNCKALVTMTELTIPYMGRRSRIIEIASIAAFQPIPYLNTYAATKAFVLSYSRALNRELMPKGITVTAVCPGWMKTEFFDVAEKTDKCITFFNQFYDPKDVVKKALQDSKKGKDVSLFGKLINAERVLEKLLPHNAVMDIWEKEQGFN